MSEHNAPLPVNKVVTSDSVNSSKLFVSKRILPIVPVVILLIIAGTFLAFHLNLIMTKNSKPTSLSEAIHIAQSNVAKAKTPPQKATAYQDLANADLNDSQPQAAIANYNNAISADSSIRAQVLGALGYLYATNGQTALAINAYQELISVLKQNNQGNAKSVMVNYPTEIEDAQQAVESLQTTGTL